MTGSADKPDAPAGPRRFYERVDVESVDGGYGIALDGRAVRTPAKAVFRVPSHPLADRIAAEWGAQGDTIDPASMPFTGLANAAIDRIGPAREAVIDQLLGYADSDPVCFRAEQPADLVERESAVWDPLVSAFNERFGVTLRLSTGIAHVAQNAAVTDALRAYADARDDFALTAFADAAGHLGSLVVAVAVLEGDIGGEQAFEAAYLEELLQADRWGLDKEAEDRRRRIRADLETAIEFERLLGRT